jgi:pimeloyl-ACP methyl ester carboxylesterase
VKRWSDARRPARSALRSCGTDLWYAVSGEDLGPGQVWALNVHGLSEDGRVYVPESERLAAALGWRVVTPSLPGFGTSPALPYSASTVDGLAVALGALLDVLDVRSVVLIGHSMGGAVVVRLASDEPERTAGVVYRSGCATPAWRSPRLTAGAAALVETMEAAAAGTPFAGWSALPRVWRLCSSQRGLRLATSLCTDLTAEIEELARRDVPMLCVWGRSDLIVPSRGADEFRRASGSDVVWVSGGHFWMKFRPDTQATVLRDHPAGRAFVERVNRRVLGLHQFAPVEVPRSHRLGGRSGLASG